MNETPVTLNVTLAEAVGLVNLLGSTPTQSGVFPLYVKLLEQVQPLLPSQEGTPRADQK